MEENDDRLSDALEVLLKDLGVTETDDLENRRRERALLDLNQLIQDWVKDDTIAQGYSKETAAKCACKVYSFGSYRLGVHNKTSDIDLLIVGPRHVNRGRFFTSFFLKMKEKSCVSYIKGVPDAYVPVIKCVFDGISMDIVYGQLNQPTVSSDFDIFDDRNLLNLDPKSVLSLNGCRTTDTILKLVPNIANFRFLLRVVKLWAKRKGIYSHAFGYLGGVSWAILAARVCQMYPEATVCTLIANFYLVYANWSWPNAVYLTDAYYTGNSVLDANVWNASLNVHPAPIITPAYPCVNTASNVSPATLRVIQREFTRAAELVASMSLDSIDPTTGWRQVFEESEFFSLYHDYLCVTVSGATKEEQREWLGWVESRIRLLTQKMSESPLTFRPFARLFPCGTKEDPHADQFFVGLDGPFKGPFKGPIDVSWAIRDFEFAVLETYHKRQEGMEIDVRTLKSSQLPSYVTGAIRSRQQAKEALRNNNNNRRPHRRNNPKEMGSRMHHHQPSSDPYFHGHHQRRFHQHHQYPPHQRMERFERPLPVPMMGMGAGMGLMGDYDVVPELSNLSL